MMTTNEAEGAALSLLQTAVDRRDLDLAEIVLGAYKAFRRAEIHLLNLAATEWSETR